jgi:F-type H+-transporting ATPase subunit b
MSFENFAIFDPSALCPRVFVNMHLLLFAETIQLFPDGSLFVHVALILLMIYILNRTFYRPVNRIIEAREKHKGGHASEAEEILKGVGEKESRYNKELLDARSRGYEFVEKEQKKAAAASEEKLKKAKAEAAATFESGKAEIEKQAAEVRTEIESEAGKLADKIAANILNA